MAPPSGTCARCGKAASQRCPRCFEGLDMDGNPLPTVLYCDKDCQAKDWDSHKSLCRDASARKQLFRGANLVQEVAYIFREIYFDFEPTEIKREGHQLHLHMPWFKPADHKGQFYPFPNHLVLSQEEKNAVLTWNTCSDLTGFMSKLIKKVVDGICDAKQKTNPREADFTIEESKYYIFRHFTDFGSVDTTEYHHTIVCVKLKDGEEYALDPAGAQFRQPLAVMPLSQYMEGWGRLPRGSWEIGHYEKRWRSAVKYRQDPVFEQGYDYIHMYAQQEAIGAMNEAIEKWESEAGKTVATMLTAKQEQFETDKKVLVATVTAAMRNRMQKWEATEEKSIPEPQSIPSLAEQMEMFSLWGLQATIV